MIPQRTGIYVGATPLDGIGNRRRHGRLRVREVECNLGHVIEISASGMRIQRRWRPPSLVGQVEEVHLTSPFGPLDLTTKTVWSKRTSFLWFESGLLFLDMGQDRRATLMELVRNSIDPAGMGEPDAA